MLERLNKNDEKLFSETAKVFYRESRSLKTAREFLKNKFHYLVVATIESKIVGFIFAYRLDSWHEDSSELFVYDIEVSKSHRRMGIASNLFEYLWKIAKAENLKLWLLTNKSNKAAVGFYNSLGGKQKNQDDVIYYFDPRKI